MATPTDQLTINEAAALSRVTPAWIRKGVQEQWVRHRTVHGHKMLDARSVPALILLKEISVPLPLKEKRRVVQCVYQPDFDPSAPFSLDSSLYVHPSERVQDGWDQAQWYAHGKRHRITRDPRVKAGEPVIAGTRIGVYVIAERLRLGDTVEMLLDDFPHIDRDAIELARMYAAANPLRGRPRRTPV